MSLVKCFIVSALAVGLLTINTLGQNELLKSQRDLWRGRAETITDNLIREVSKVDELERALLFAQMGDLWRQSNSSQSDVWFEKAVDTIFFYSTNDTKDNRKIFFQTTRQILNIISNKNQKQSNRLLKILTELNKDDETEKDVNADALIKYALQIVKDNPSSAAQIGITALRTGRPKEFYKLILELNRGNKPLANLVFREALAIARISPDYYILQNLQIAAFPENMQIDFPSDLMMPPQIRSQTLNFFADYIIQLQADLITKKISKCSTEALQVSQLKKQFVDLLPQRAALVQQAIDICLAEQSAQRRQIQDTIKSGTVEELLKLADENKDDPLVRTAYLYRAALLSYSQKKYEITIEILESMNENERQANLEFWEQARAESAGFLAYVQLQKDDLQSSYKTLQDTPSLIRPFAQVVFLKQFPENESSNYSLRAETLNETRKNFIASEKSFAEKTNYWFSLIKLYSSLKLQAEAAEVFKEIVKASNTASEENSNGQDEIKSNMISSSFSANLFEKQETTVLNTVGLIREYKARINVNLAFLKLALQRYEEINSEIEKLKQDKIKKN